MSIGFKIGTFVGANAARAVHYTKVAAENSGQFGRDLAAGAQSGYTDKRSALAADRAAKWAAIAAKQQPQQAAAAMVVEA